MSSHEIRLDKKGEIDDVVIQCDQIHFERMDNHWFWMAVYKGDERTVFHFNAKSGDIEVLMDENDLELPVITKGSV